MFQFMKKVKSLDEKAAFLLRYHKFHEIKKIHKCCKNFLFVVIIQLPQGEIKGNLLKWPDRK